MYQSFAFQFFVQLLLDGHEYFWIDDLELNIRAVINRSFKTGNIIVGLFDRVGQQNPL